MYHAALIEHQHFPQAWKGVAIVYGQFENKNAEEVALKGMELAEKKEEIPQVIWDSIEMVPKAQRLVLLTLYRIVYGSRFRLEVF
jgi:hypothetical protein